MCLLLIGCGQPAKNKSCTGVCIPPHWTHLDLLAGQPGGHGWVDGTLTAAHFADPWTMASDGQGHLFVADGETIRSIDLPDGTVSTVAGAFRQIGGSDGIGAQASFDTPSGLAYAAGQLYVTDTENHTIRKIDLASATVTTIAGASGQPGAVDAVGTAARFLEPEGLALDGSGNLYIADTDNNTIRVMALATGMVTTLAGKAGVTGASDGVGAAASFSKPKAIALDGNGNLYVVDTLNQRIRKVVVATGTVSTLPRFQAYTLGVAVVGGDLWASLADNTVVRVSTSDGTTTPLLGASGMVGFTDGSGSAARFNNPAGLWFDGASSVYVVDETNAAIRIVNVASGAVVTFAGAISHGSVDGIGSAARFFAPQGLTADADNIYVADTNNDLIRKIVIATGTVTTIAGAAGQMGTSDGKGGAARFNAPTAVAVSGETLYVADTGNHRLRRIDLTSGNVTTLVVSAAPGAAFSGLDQPSCLAISGGHLYIGDFSQNTIYDLDLTKMTIDLLAGTLGVPGGADGVGVQARFLGPLGIAADGNGQLFVADSTDDDVRQIDIATRAVTTLAGTSQSVGDGDGVAGAALFHYPSGIAADGVGDVYVADTANALLRHIDGKSRVVTTLVGNRAAAGVRLGPLPAQLGQVETVALTPSGALAIVSENSVLIAR
jgi:sugar lactone lactonase YvrE